MASTIAVAVAFVSQMPALLPPSSPRVCRRQRPRACASPPQAKPDSQAKSDAKAKPEATGTSTGALESYVVVPGKIVLNEAELVAQKAALAMLEARYNKTRLQAEYDASRRFGFVPFAEELQGRAAMMGFVIGLLTEYWTGYTIPQQIELMANTIGIY
jgi:hypothetical protein